MAFQPPPKSLHQLTGVPFADAKDFAAAAKAKYDAFDRTGTHDPNKCKALLVFPDDSAVFWSSKMAVDADGPAAPGPGRRNGKELDPANGLLKTSYSFPQGGFLPSETIPYIVLPLNAPGGRKPFDPLVAIGDMAIVIFGDKITAAICGDLGPDKKIGEGSIRVHEALMQHGAADPCATRDGNGFCKRIHDASVEEDVLFFVFPGSAFTDADNLTLQDVESRIKERAFGLYNKLRGVGGNA